MANQKAPNMTPGQRVELMVYYAVCCFRLGNVEKGVNTLEQQFRKTETGLIYQTLGYLYVEQYDQARNPALDYAAILAADPGEEEAAGGEAPAEEKAGEEAGEPEAAAAAETDGEPEAPPEPTPEEIWNAGRKKAEAFIRKSIEYDDEDSICQDNMGQFVYRVLGDKAAAREWFDRAIALKSSQIDTLWFLSRYDLESGNMQAALEKLEEAAAGRFSPLNYCQKDQVMAEIARLKGETQA